MLNKIMTTVMTVMLVTFFFVGCDSSGGGASGYSAPAVMSVEELPPSGATVFPDDSTETEAITLFSNAITAINTNIDLEEDSSYNPDIRKARATTPETIEIDVVTPIGDGYISYKGFASFTMKSPDEDFAPSPNTTYKDIFKVGAKIELDGTVNNCLVPYYDTAAGNTINLTINGESKERLLYDISTTVHFGTTEANSTAEIDLYASVAYGASYSITNEDGFGGKFTVSFNKNFERNFDGSMADEEFDIDVDNEMTNTVATLKVYNDDNELVLTTTVPLSILLENAADF